MNHSTETADRRPRRISTCTGCEQALPLRLTASNEKSIAWTCSACGAPYLAVLDESAEVTLHRNVRVSDKLFAHCRAQAIPQGMASFLRELARLQNNHERRKQKRYPMTIRATAIPVDEHLSPLDEAFTAMTLNISQSGIALIHTRAISHRFLLIELDNEQRTQVVLEVIRCRHVGRFYDIAGRFMTRLGTIQSSANR